MPSLKEKTEALEVNYWTLIIFDSISAARYLSEEWRLNYNAKRQHKSLGYLSSQKYTEQYFKNNQTEKTFENQKQLI